MRVHSRGRCIKEGGHKGGVDGWGASRGAGEGVICLWRRSIKPFPQ